MPILETITTATMQTFFHLLQELEAEGVTTLSVAREKTAIAMDNRRAELRGIRRPPSATKAKAGTGKPLPPSEPCPDCPSPAKLSPVVGEDIDGELVWILQCKQCRYSKIVEDRQ